MKKFLTIIILSLYFITPSQADDIRDFQINGISLGDSLLSFYSKELIQQTLKDKKKSYFYKDKKYADLFLSNIKKEEPYDFIQITIKPSEKLFYVHSIAGQINFQDNMVKCQKEKEIIISDIKNLFPKKNFETFFVPHSIDKSGESKVDQSNLLLANGIIQVECYDWSKKFSYSDKLIVSIKNLKFRDFLMNAY
tara:strand:+ start:2599 stop:3180 length:582 start_codon:yes stop_codon:yes gene_type:complete